MRFIDELDFGDEIRGVVCPVGGCSLVWKHGRAYCYDDGYVTPIPDRPTSPDLPEEAIRWLDEHKHELETEID